MKAKKIKKLSSQKAPHFMFYSVLSIPLQLNEARVLLEVGMQGLDLVKKNQNSEKFGSSFIKNDLPFIYKNPIIKSLLKTVTLKFTMYILTIFRYSLKPYITGKFFAAHTFLNLTFNELFPHNKISLFFPFITVNTIGLTKQC